MISEDVLPKQEIEFLSWKVSLQCDDKDYGALTSESDVVAREGTILPLDPR